MEIDKGKFPDNLYYDKHYQWIMRSNNKIRFGITPYGLDITGDVLYLSFPASGTPVETEGSCGSLESGKWVGRIYSPVSGRVTAVNQAVLSSPDIVNQAPYDCWFIEIELANPDELNQLMNASDAAKWLEEDGKIYA